MSKKKIFIPLAALSLLISTLAACGGGTKTSEPATSSSEEPKTSQTSSAEPSSSVAPSSSSEAPQSPVTSTTTTHVDGRGESIEWDAQDANKEASEGFTSAGKFTAVGDYVKYTFVSAKAGKARLWVQVDNRTDSPYKRSDQTGNQSIWYDYYNKRDEGGDWKYKVEVNGAEIDQAAQGTFKVGEEDVALKELMYTDFLADGKVVAPWFEFNLVAGNNVLRIERNNGYSVNAKKFIVATRIAGAQEQIIDGYTVTFAGTHAKALVYESGKDYSKNPVEATTTKTRDENGYITGYLEGADGIDEIKPQVNFRVQVDEGYEFDDGVDKSTLVADPDDATRKEVDVKPDKVSWISPAANYNKLKVIEITGTDGSKTYIYRTTKVKGPLTITLEGTQPVAQPTGVFFASAEITDAGKTALQTTNSIVPIFINLGADNAVTVSVNGVSAGACSIKSYNKLNGDLVITTASFGDLTMTYNPEKSALEKLSVVNAKTVLKWDAGQSLVGGDKLKYWNCDGTTEELQAQWNRRYGNPWTLDNNNPDKVTKNTEHAISGSAMRLRPYASDRIALAAKDFDPVFNCKNLSFWVYNSGTANMTIQAFGYKQANYGTANMVSIKGNTTIEAGKWTYCSFGFTASDLYAFQIFVAAGASALIFDDICLF